MLFESANAKVSSRFVFSISFQIYSIALLCNCHHVFCRHAREKETLDNSLATTHHFHIKITANYL